MSKPDPWKEFAATHQRGDRIVSRVTRIVEDIGLFIALDGGIEGIVHLNDLDWTIPSEDAITRYLTGDQVEVMILRIQPEYQRATLGIKQLGPDPRSNDGEGPPVPVPVTPKTPTQPSSQAAAAKRE